MIRRHYFIAVSLLIASSGFAVPQTADVIRDGGGLQAAKKAAVNEAKTDAKALEAVGLKADEPEGLLKYLKQRSLGESDLKKINEVLKRMSDDDFEVRQRASKEVLDFGSAAIGPLRKAAAIDSNNINAADFELAHRANEVLKSIDKVPYAQVSAAVVRAVGKSPSAESNRILLGFLPSADGPIVAAEIQKVLIAHALRDGKADPALLEGLKSSSPMIRRFAVEALVRGGDAKARIRIPDAFPAVRAATKVESDPDVKFTMSFLAATISRDREATEELLDSIPQLKRGHLWQVEDLLLQLAGDAAPKAVFATSVDALKKAQATWKEWWNQNRDNLKLNDWEYRPRTNGTMLVVLSDLRLGTGLVAELAPDLSDLWRIGNLASNPGDVAVLPDGRIVVAEMNTSIISFRDSSGTVISRVPITFNLAGRGMSTASPQQLQVLPDGNILVTCRNLVSILKPDNSLTVVYARGNMFDISSATMLPNGETAVLVQNGPNHLVFVDKANKEIPDRVIKVNQPWYQSYMTSPASGRLLFTEQTQVVEMDVAKGEIVWKKACLQPRCVQRLPNGNTLIVEGTQPTNNRIIEVSPEGVEVWAHTLPGGFYIQRAYRR